MKKSLMFTFLLLLLVSCHKYISSSIINNTNNQIILKVKMDHEAIEKLRKEYVEKGLMVSDKIHNDYEVKIDSYDVYTLDIKRNIRPDFYDIKEIEIYSGDTLILKCRKDQMQKLFSNEQNTEGYDLIINN